MKGYLSSAVAALAVLLLFTNAHALSPHFSSTQANYSGISKNLSCNNPEKLWLYGKVIGSISEVPNYASFIEVKVKCVHTSPFEPATIEWKELDSTCVTLDDKKFRCLITDDDSVEKLTEEWYMDLGDVGVFCLDADKQIKFYDNRPDQAAAYRYSPAIIFEDVCDGNYGDTDGDHVPNPSDNCVTTENYSQDNSDGDDFGDACDNCKYVVNNDQADSDTINCIGGVNPPPDGVGDACDNCVAVCNADQLNTDGDSQGNACDPDDDNDGILDDGDSSGVEGVAACTNGNTTSCDDNCPLVPNPDQADGDFDGIGNACDPYTAYVPEKKIKTTPVGPDKAKPGTKFGPSGGATEGVELQEVGPIDPGKVPQPEPEVKTDVEVRKVKRAR